MRVKFSVSKQKENEDGNGKENPLLKIGGFLDINSLAFRFSLNMVFSLSLLTNQSREETIYRSVV